MSSIDRDLVAALRAELASVEPTRPCDLAAEWRGLGMSATADGSAPASRRDPVLARLVVRLERRGGPVDGLPFDWPASPEHCRMAYLRGRFLARGSLSIAGARTHLEFVITPLEAPHLAGWLEDAGMPASWRIRRGRGPSLP